VGSGAGIKQIKAKTVDFGASDMPLTDDELAKDGMVQFPTVIGGVVPVVNIKGIKPGQIKLTGPGAGRHLPGQDHQVERRGAAGLNPGVPLPMPPSPWCAAPTVRAPASSSPTTCPR
jgi:phosphate transport system substrate-binding protein